MALPRRTQQAIIGNQALEKEHLNEFIQELYKKDRRVFQETQDTARALVLQAANDYNLADLGDSYIYGLRRCRRRSPRLGIPEDHTQPAGDSPGHLATAGDDRSERYGLRPTRPAHQLDGAVRDQ